MRRSPKRKPTTEDEAFLRAIAEENPLDVTAACIPVE